MNCDTVDEKRMWDGFAKRLTVHSSSLFLRFVRERWELYKLGWLWCDDRSEAIVRFALSREVRSLLEEMIDQPLESLQNLKVTLAPITSGDSSRGTKATARR